MSHSRRKYRKTSGSKTAKENKPSQKKLKDDIMKISFKDINDDYCWGRYGPFKVIIMKENGYINATKMIAVVKTKNGKKKELKHWNETASSKELIAEISAAVVCTTDDLTIVITGGNNQTICGTYVHHYLIPHIAAWASPKFAVKVSTIVNKYFIRKEIRAKEKLIEKKDDEIKKMSSKIDRLFNENQTLREMTQNIDKNNQKLTKMAKQMIRQNDDLYEINVDQSNKLDTMANDRVVSTGNQSDENVLIIIQNNDDPDDYDEDDVIYDFYALRIMNKCSKSRIIAHKERHPNMKIILTINYSPNSINLWNRIKNKLGSGRDRKIKIRNCRFNLVNGYTKTKLISDISKIHNERLNYNDI